MATEEQKTFKVWCVNPKCNQPFHVRFALVQPGAAGDADVVVECQYCGAENVITISEKYVEEEDLVRGFKGRSRGG
ncbi:MAG: hypothetical protein U9Q81_01035 [Pseudomonadota bacterium]|nr:hypothetical protein [Pseudomonadota bacterium]